MAVADLISSAQGYASSTLTDARGAFDEAKSTLSKMGYTQFFPANVGMPAPPDVGHSPTFPTLPPWQYTIPADPGGMPAFQDIGPINAGSAPSFSASAPSIVLPNKPTSVNDFTSPVPDISLDALFPEVPSQLVNPLLAEPVMGNYATPDAPTVSLPAFAGVRPTDTPEAPTDLVGTFQRSYADASTSAIAAVNGYVDAQLDKFNPQFHVQMARIEAQLTKYLDGGTGLDPAVEDAIYTRARSKNDAEARRVRDQVLSDAATRGFTLPTGALLSATQQARQAGADNNASAAREIVAMQAEMEQKNLQFAVTTSANLRTAMVTACLGYMQNLITINGQALEFSKSIVSSLVSAYSVAAQVFSTKLEAYKADAQVFNALIQGALAQVEVYKAEIQALSAMVMVDQAKVSLYRAKVDTLQAFANVYRTQVDAVVSKAQLERLKIDLFQSQVQAYAARVQAKNAEWQGYSAAIGGEQAKTQIYAAQANAFQAQVMGYKASVEAQAEVVHAAVATNQSRAAQYTAAVQAYGVISSAHGEVARTGIESQRLIVAAFSAQVQAEVSQFQVKSDYYKATAQVAVENSRMWIQAMMSNSQTALAYGEALSKVSTMQADVYGRLAGSAMAGMNSLASELKYE